MMKPVILSLCPANIQINQGTHPAVYGQGLHYHKPPSCQLNEVLRVSSDGTDIQPSHGLISLDSFADAPLI